MKKFLLALLAATAISANAQNRTDISKNLENCSHIVARYFANGIYNAGDTEELSLVLGADQAVFEAKKMVQNMNYSPVLTSKSGRCELALAYAE